MTIKIDDLKPLHEDKTDMTVERAFTICELIAHRHNKQTLAEKDTADEIAMAINEIARSWNEPKMGDSDHKADDKNISNPISGVSSDSQFVYLTLWHGDMKITKFQTWEQAIELASSLLKEGLKLRSIQKNSK